MKVDVLLVHLDYSLSPVMGYATIVVPPLSSNFNCLTSFHNLLGLVGERISRVIFGNIDVRSFSKISKS